MRPSQQSLCRLSAVASTGHVLTGMDWSLFYLILCSRCPPHPPKPTTTFKKRLTSPAPRRRSECSLFSTLCRLSADWLEVKPQGSILGILCSAWSYHFPPGCLPYFLLKSSKILSIFPEQEPSLCSILHYCFLNTPSLFLHSFPPLTSNCLNLHFWSQGQSRRVKNKKQKVKVA